MEITVAESFPVRHKKLSCEIKGRTYIEFRGSVEPSQVFIVTGNRTDIILGSYDDHFLVIATQIGSLGTILHASKEEGMSIEPAFNVSVIFGKRDEAMLVACARKLIEIISNSGSSKPLLLSLGLKDHSMETLKGIVSVVIENGLW